MSSAMLRLSCPGALLATLCACASTATIVEPPAVRLTGVELSQVALSGQTFRVGIEMTNPNPIAIPVRGLSYRIMLDDRKFASGEAASSFTIPARGNTNFVLSVELDLLQTGSALAHVIGSGVSRDVGYRVDGSIAVDLPLAKPLRFSNEGTIMVHTPLF